MQLGAALRAVVLAALLAGPRGAAGRLLSGEWSGRDRGRWLLGRSWRTHTAGFCGLSAGRLHLFLGSA